MDFYDHENFVTAFSQLWDGIQVLSTEELPDEILTPTGVSGEDSRQQVFRPWAQEALYAQVG